MEYFQVVSFVIILLVPVTCVDYASPLVFDPVFYSNNYGDLHIFNTSDQAKEHWLTKGIAESRQGSGRFHSKQYLQRYPDLAKAYGSNYHAALEHYLEHGQFEHRLGYVEGGYEGRYTISDGKHLFIGASDRNGGAIDSLVWRNKEFINSWDKGRELQMAANAPPLGECFNPTEAGGAADGTGDSTKSRLNSVSVRGKVMKTSVLPAFWIRHDQVEHADLHIKGNCKVGTHPANTQDTYQHPFSKEVTIGCVGLDTCIKFVSHFEIAGQWPEYQFINFEAPTAYLLYDFTVIKNFNPANNQLQPHSSMYLPPVIITPDNKFAMGVFSPGGQDTDRPLYYGTWTMDGTFIYKSSKWSVVFVKNRFTQGSHHRLSYVSYICVGTPSMVVECLRKLHHM